MAQPIVTPENLAQAVEEIKAAAGSGSGDSNYVNVQVVISTREDEKQRIYLALDPSVDVSDCTLRFGRTKRTRDRDKLRKEDEQPMLYSKGWHQVWAIPVADKVPLFNNLRLKSKYADFHGKALYEITSGEYDSLRDFLIDDENNDTGYRGKNADDDEIIVTRDMIVANSRCGICLVRDDEIISNYGTFGGVYDQGGDFWLRK